MFLATQSAGLSADEMRVYTGVDLESADRAFSVIRNASLIDHQGRRHDDDLEMQPLFARCQNAYKRAIWEEQRNLPPYLFADELAGMQLGDRSIPNDPRIVYFIAISRSRADLIVSRLLLALYHSSHLFLIHVDLKTEDRVRDELAALTINHPNVKFIRTRRLVQWGAWTMVSIMLDALKTVVQANIDFDFFINLSDADVALRTHEEIVGFLRPYKGHQFVQVAV